MFNVQINGQTHTTITVLKNLKKEKLINYTVAIDTHGHGILILIPVLLYLVLCVLYCTFLLIAYKLAYLTWLLLLGY